MKKIVRTSLNNVVNKRGVRDLNVQLYSHDRNNAGFEFVIKNEEDLSQYKATVLFDFQDTFATLETTGTIEGNVVKVKFDTDLITKCEEVIGYLMLDSETNSLDVFKFKFNVVLSQIDRPDLGKRGFRYIKDQEVVDVITRSELEEELRKLQINGGIDLSNYLTTSVANETFATKQELGSYATKDELPSISGLVTTEQLTAAKNSVVEEISNKGYVTSTTVEETYAKKSEIPTPYNDNVLVQKIGQLEARVDKDTVYDDTALKERVTALESKAIEGGAYDDTHLRERLDTLEAKQDKDTVYNDEEVKQRLTVLENKPVVDTSHFITDETLNSKNYLTTTVAEETYAKKSEIPQAYNDSVLAGRVAALEIKNDKDTVYDDTGIKERLSNLENKPSVDTSHFVTNEILESKGFLTTEELEEKHYVTNEQISSTYATKSEIPQPYSDTELVKRITVLENRQDNDTVYDDAELKRRVTALEEKPNVDTSNFITTALLESKGYLTTHQDISNLVTRKELQEATRGITRSGIKMALVIGWKEIYIENMRFTSTMNLIDSTSNDNLRNINNLEIRRVNNATSGYIIYNNKTKNFTLEALETDLRTKTADDYLVAVMWNNNYYTENGVLKNKPKPVGKINPNTRIVTLGDSITQGLKNYNSPRELFSKAWPNYMLESYGGTLRNIAVSGKSISGTGAEDFNGQVNSVNFNDFDLAIIAMGVNDFNNQSNLTDVIASLKKGLNKIFTDNKNIQVAGILPHNLFRLPFTSPANTVYVDGMKYADKNGKTLNDFCNAIASVYDEYQIPYIDWRKAPVLTLRNYNKWTWDAIHPNEIGHALIGRRVAEWLKVNV